MKNPTSGQNARLQETEQLKGIAVLSAAVVWTDRKSVRCGEL